MIKRLFVLFALCAFSPLLQAGGLKAYTSNAPTPVLKLQDLQGKVHDLSDYKGQVVLVQFWATYCTPCRKEMPSMNKLIKKMGNTPFKILAVDMGESKEEVSRFVQQVKPEFTILMDPTGQSISAWRVFAAPSNFIIGPQGKIRYTLFGGIEWDSADMVKKLKALAASES
jgi:peroxiredoxin